MTNHRPVSITFTQELPSGFFCTDDLIPTAIARTSKTNTPIALNCRRRIFSAGGYFAHSQDFERRLIIETYINNEHVFPDEETANIFLQLVGRNPKKSQYILFMPKYDIKSDVVILLVNASKASKILGLSAYYGLFDVDVVPAAPTCAAIFRPLIEPNRIHINFIDYFDREYQAKGCFEEEEFLVSMRPALYKKLCVAFTKSAHGNSKPNGLPIY
ncbi:DUF169 domain-containing protein [Patescibacteria group bacterium]|nr:DUF169 domain-containing protein [Patescibacteria group bacterium]